MAPLIGQVAFGFNWGWQGIATAVLLGLVGGFLVAALVGHVFQMHLGYSLYNTGITGGFVCLIMYMMMRGYGITVAPSFLWSTNYTEPLVLFVAFVLLMMLLLGVYCNGSMPAYRNLLKTSGKLSTDFVELFGMGTTLINMSIVGTIALAYVLFVGGVLNGPTLAGVLTVTGFGSLGKHPRNIVPIMLGVYLVCLLKIWSPADPGPLLAALFCTNLAPLAGQFGFWAGVIAGAVHLPMAMHVGSIYGFLNLYNNGFAGGIAAMVIIGFLKGMKPDILDRRKPWYVLSD
jgi:hypothetical protein